MKTRSWIFPSTGAVSKTWNTVWGLRSTQRCPSVFDTLLEDALYVISMLLKQKVSGRKTQRIPREAKGVFNQKKYV